MRSIPPTVALLAMLVFAGGAVAQQGVPPGPGRAAQEPLVGPDLNPGWSMMSRAERDEHRRRMLSAQTQEQCRQAMDEFRKQMEERAKARGFTIRGPRRDHCVNFPA